MNEIERKPEYKEVSYQIKKGKLELSEIYYNNIKRKFNNIKNILFSIYRYI